MEAEEEHREDSDQVAFVEPLDVFRGEDPDLEHDPDHERHGHGQSRAHGFGCLAATKSLEREQHDRGHGTSAVITTTAPAW